jgi:hypothetical protein
LIAKQKALVAISTVQVVAEFNVVANRTPLRRVPTR